MTRLLRLSLWFGLVLLLASAAVVTYTQRQYFMQDRSNGSVVSLGRMRLQRAAHSATVLRDGRVLIAGGMEQAEGEEINTASAELFDPSTKTFAPAAAMNQRRAGHTATLLPSGDVLIAGGFDEGVALQSVEIFRSSTATFERVGDMLEQRDRHSSTLLNDGTVLIVGGNKNVGNNSILTAELFDPAKGIFVSAGSMWSPRSAHTATLLHNGTVLIAGGSAKRFDEVLNTAEIYDPDEKTFKRIADMNSTRHKHAATLLPDGNVLLTGGSDDARAMGGRENTAEIYDPSLKTFRLTGAMVKSRFKLTTAVVGLGNGHVVVAGDGAYVEVYNSQTKSYGTASGKLSDALMYATAVMLKDGSVLIAGGYDEDMEISEGVWLYRPA